MSGGLATVPRLGGWAAKRIAHHAGLLALARLARQRRRGIVMRYHAVSDGRPVEYAAPDICISVSALRLQMAFIRRAYGVVPLDELVDRLHAGGPLPPRALAVTFDDGYADNYHLAFPLLRELGIPATVYVVTGCLDDAAPFWVGVVHTLVHRAAGPVACPGVAAPLPVGSVDDRAQAARALTRALVPLPTAERHAWLDAAAKAAGVDARAALRGSMMTWAQAREMAAAGWTIGAHTVTHGNLTLLPPAEAEAELAESRAAIEQHVGRPALHFCYPNTGGQVPSHDDGAAALVRRLGYRSATTSRPGAVRPGDDPYRIRRLGVSPRLTLVADLAAALERQRLAA
jgi:peptidoglycan/xylan/chitin deacetylase (PgdA/CDA1 family)